MISKLLNRELLEPIADVVADWIALRRDALQIPGVAVAISFKGDLLLNTTYGVADTSTGAALTTDHLFHIASHSKTFTATAIMQLVQHGKLRLDDRVGSHLPWTREAGMENLAGSSLAELMSHGSGLIRDSVDGDFWQLSHPFPDVAELRELLRAQSEVFPANDRFHYSNMGYAILGLIIETVTGESFSAFLQRSIFEPLELARTAVDPTAGDTLLASGHTRFIDGRRRPIESVKTYSLAPATGVASTASDLCKYFAAHCFGDERILSDASKRRMQHIEWRPREGEFYGLGLMALNVEGWSLFGHSGGFPGVVTKTWCDPQSGLVVSVLTNASDGAAGDFATGIVKLIAGLAKMHVSEPATTSPSPFKGRFANMDNNCALLPAGKRVAMISLDVNDPDAWISELTPETETTLRISKTRDGYSSEGEVARVEFDAGGAISLLRADSGMSYFPAASFESQLASRDRIVLQRSAQPENV